jgi:hypothetical protein
MDEDKEIEEGAFPLDDDGLALDLPPEGMGLDFGDDEESPERDS